MLLILLSACTGDWPAAEPLDLVEALGPDDVRAGVVTDERALFGGTSAEGAIGDVKLYNDRVRFVVQGARDSSYYVGYGGSLIDADIVRDEAEPGRDIIDEFAPMIGLARLVEPETVSVLSDGMQGLPAVVRVVGHGAPMLLATGALEAPTLVPERDVRITTDYVLEPASWLLRIDTTVAWNDESTSVQVGDFAMLGAEVVEPWAPGRGFDENGETSRRWTAVEGNRGEVALALFSSGDGFAAGALQDLLGSIGPVLTGFEDPVTLERGDELSWSRWLGVGPDLATLSGAALQARGEPTTTLSGTVTAAGAPVAGARVHVLDADGGPVTVAHSDDGGAWSAEVAEGGSYQVVATGRGRAIETDLPEGFGWVGPYAADPAKAAALASLEGAATPIPFAEGYGISEPVAAGDATALTLAQPGILHVEVADGGPAVVRVAFADGDPVGDVPALAPGRPSGLMTLAFVRDGDIDLVVEPGAYDVLVHRGARFEPHVQSVEVAPGETTVVSATLTEAWSVDSLFALDPHSHAAPSADGGISMADRLIVQAANGIDVHFGTDHDHVADYRPMLAPLGLDDRLASVVADEFSPVLRGHFNVYPLEEAPDEPNHGAWPWWGLVEDTDALFGHMRDMLSASDAPDGGIVQVNHPVGGLGMWGLADYDPTTGEIGSPDHWSDDFDTVEVLNDGQWEDYLAYYMDLVARGMDPIPVGVSDSHSHTGGAGENLTWLPMGIDDVSQLTPAALVTAMKTGGTVPSTGPLVVATIGGQWAPGGIFDGTPTLDVAVFDTSFSRIDTLTLYRDGEVVEVVAADDAGGFLLDGEDGKDHAWFVVANGSSDMSPVFPGRQPWAATAAIKNDVDGDGWQAPLPGPTRR